MKMTPLEQAINEFKEISEKVESIKKELKAVNNRRKEIIILMLSWGMSYKDIAKEVGLSKQRIYQIKHNIRSGRRDKPGELV